MELDRNEQMVIDVIEANGGSIEAGILYLRSVILDKLGYYSKATVKLFNDTVASLLKKGVIDESESTIPHPYGYDFVQTTYELRGHNANRWQT